MSIPAHLYYYTTLDTVQKIIQNRTLWLGDYRFMNDVNEITYSADIAEKYIKDKQDKCNDTYSVIQDEIERIKKGESTYYAPYEDPKYGELLGRENTTHMGRYILSLSDKKDDIGMWVLYGQKELGCRIKFDVNELYKYIRKQVDTVYPKAGSNGFSCLGKVNYSEDSIIAAIEHENFWSQFESCVARQCSIFNILAMHKHPDYKDENEFRIVCSVPDKENMGAIDKVYLQNDNCIKPFIEIKNLPIETAISEIMISPYNKSELAVLGLQDWIYHKSRANIKVVKSGIAIR